MIRGQISDEELADAWDQGRALTLDEAVAFALASSAAAAASPSSPSSVGSLPGTRAVAPSNRELPPEARSSIRQAHRRDCLEHAPVRAAQEEAVAAPVPAGQAM